MASMGLAGCFNNSNSKQSGNGDTTHIAIISSSAGFGDKAFNDLAWKGLENAAEDYNIKLQKVEATNPSKYQSIQSRLAESNNPDYDLIVLVGYEHTKGLKTNAKEYPDQKWMIINTYIDQPNVGGYIWANHQMSYQAGVLGATMTPREFSYKGSSLRPDDLTIGFVGGADSSLIHAFERGYKAGAKYIEPDIEVLTGYIGNYTDTRKAANIASAQYDSGADIVYHAAAAAGQGVFEAAQNNDRFAIGVDARQSITLPQYKDVIMGSAVKFINKGTYRVAKYVANGKWDKANGKHVVGLEGGGVKLVLGQAIGPKLPDIVSQNLDETRQKIINGDITVPCSASGC